MRISPFNFKETSVMNSLTRAQVTATLGPVDDVIVNAIIGMGSTLEELCEAKAWIANDEAFMNMAVWASWLKF
jgi:glycerol-3-phosphate cytidylyltransferase-like family protein